MGDSSNWRVARLEDIERRGTDIPVREHLDDFAAVRDDARFEQALR